jgi:hypothetical protein
MPSHVPFTFTPYDHARPGASYASWKAEAAQELQLRYGLEATAIAERIWTQFYVRRLTPKQAADRAEMVYDRARPVTSWLNKT